MSPTGTERSDLMTPCNEGAGRHAVVETLSEGQCLALLGSVPVGRMVFTYHALPSVQPVAFVLDGHTVVVRTVPASDLFAVAASSVVAFAADEGDFGDTGSGWHVTAVGRADLVTDPDELARLRGLPLEPWSTGHNDHFLRIRIELIQGSRIRRFRVQPDAAEASAVS